HIDQLVLREHTWKHNPHWDPEGILSTLPAVATTLLGVLAGLILESRQPTQRKILRLLAWGWVWAILGLAWNSVFPINKNLWTSSYALFMAGLACAPPGLFVLGLGPPVWAHPGQPLLSLGPHPPPLFPAGEVAAAPPPAL